MSIPKIQKSDLARLNRLVCVYSAGLTPIFPGRLDRNSAQEIVVARLQDGFTWVADRTAVARKGSSHGTRIAP